MQRRDPLITAPTHEHRLHSNTPGKELDDSLLLLLHFLAIGRGRYYAFAASWFVAIRHGIATASPSLKALTTTQQLQLQLQQLHRNALVHTHHLLSRASLAIRINYNNNKHLRLLQAVSTTLERADTHQAQPELLTLGLVAASTISARVWHTRHLLRQHGTFQAYAAHHVQCFEFLFLVHLSGARRRRRRQRLHHAPGQRLAIIARRRHLARAFADRGHAKRVRGAMSGIASPSPAR